ncbi:Conserved hypothetical protein (plasmid) [Candidatus Protochlamydia naegleriophila]|uniref:ATPase n=1 Tax=Candidatus Protochlamydia naegleriophila TaxID=389348 RepID=A0A0U5JJC1_9BACT|nr:ATP-binding protein [Candidatus Protochlamydia naegleriophila]CUI18085.1 Conserved hypothetical protein [Candidatus Protochlamydia naegleriophila]
MKFIDRKKELSRLNHLIDKDDSGMAVVIGRRRLGKTRLLLEWAHPHKPIYYMADESSPTLQRKYFALALQEVLPNFASVEYNDWHSLFTRLAIDASYIGWKGPLIIDELPYLISTSPEIASILQRFIDHDAKKSKMVIALSGSSQRMMQGAILDASAPLFGRAKEIIKLGPIPIGYMQEALDIQNSRDIVEAYSVWGGVPRYWELAANQKASLLEQVNHLVLDPLGALNDEPNHLLLEESASSLRPILDAIGLGAHRLSEIATKVGQQATSLNRSIQRLIELDLIEREIPFGAEEYNSKRTLYKISDPFMRFWFELVASQRSFLTKANDSQRIKYLHDSIQRIFSLCWEDLCRLAAPILSQQFEHELIFGTANRYWHKSNPEWDILSESMDKKALFIGEAKWVINPPNTNWIYKTIEELKAKGLSALGKGTYHQTFYGLFVPEKPHSLSLSSNVKVFDASDVINALK